MGLRVAVLDDDLDCAASLRDYFNAAGYVADMFVSAATMQQALVRQSHDVYICDWTLRLGETPTLLIEQVLATTPKPVVIVLSGDLNLRSQRTMGALQQSGVLLFEKPARPSALRAAIEQARNARFNAE